MIIKYDSYTMLIRGNHLHFFVLLASGVLPASGGRGKKGDESVCGVGGEAIK